MSQGSSFPEFPAARPTHFPEDCPPLPLTSRAGRFIRLVSRGPTPLETDFLPHAELPDYTAKGGRGSRCRDCALSMFETPEAAHNFLDNHPTFGKRRMAEMGVPAFVGVMHPEPAGHDQMVNWWLPSGLSFQSFYLRCLDAQ